MLTEIFPSLFLIRASDPPPQTPFTYLLRRPEGNVLFATKADVTTALPEIEKLGGAAMILLGDRHHAGPKLAALAKRLHAPVRASAVEAKVIGGGVVDAPLPFEAQRLGEDLEAIPTQGHTPGALSYVWTHKKRRFLFIGDTLVPVDGVWRSWVSKPNRAKMMGTIDALSKQAFDVVVSNSFASTPKAWIEVTAAQRTAMFKVLKAEFA
jgi:glyoxylase-like metal-dependent hydrolase (beta-lactamase superfamily II)